MRDGMTTDGDRPVRDEDDVLNREVGSPDRRCETAAAGTPEQRGRFGDRRIGGLSDRALHGK